MRTSVTLRERKEGSFAKDYLVNIFDYAITIKGPNNKPVIWIMPSGTKTNVTVWDNSHQPLFEEDI